MAFSYYFAKERRGITVTVIVLGTALLTVLCAYLVFGDDNDEEGLKSIRMVGIVFRHGHRTPTESYPTDPYLNYNWKGGKASLTVRGVKQMYQLGKNLKSRYYRLFPSDGLYTQHSIHVRSSYAERCLMSAQSFLAGFMPPLEHNSPLSPLDWQPIAVHSMPREQDILIAQKKPCPKYDDTLEKLYLNPPHDVMEMNLKNANLYRSLTKNTGRNISTILDVESIYNTLDVERDNGQLLPDWTEGLFPEKMLPIAERSLSLFTETPHMKKVKGGALFSDILKKLIEKRSGLLSPNRSIFIYSAHDVTLVNLMNAMGILDDTSRKPTYGAALAIEMHHSFLYNHEDMEIKVVYYFNSDDKFPKEINIPGCDRPCSLTNFEKAMSNIILRNYDDACHKIEN